jgi:transcription initiation factor TFIIIB Brf1 subunit/transcription initiation factor TFIIB
VIAGVCARCGAVLREEEIGPGCRWSADMHRGRIVGLICPACQTPDEDAEAQFNAETLVYGRDASGRCVASPKVTPASGERVQ